jgi:hypothetical protein
MKKGMFVSLAALALGAAAMAQTVLYEGISSLADQKMKVSGWGAGIVTETSEAAFEGTSSVRISTRNFFQGGRLNYDNPVNLSGMFDNKANLLMFTLNVPKGTTSGGTTTPGAPGAGGSGGSSAGIADGGGRGAAGGTQTATATPAGANRIRVVIQTSDGMLSETFLDISDSDADPRGWRRIGVPLSAINGFGRTNKQITSITFSAGEAITFYVGQIKILDDTTPIYAEPTNSRELELGLNDTVTFAANGSGGATRLIYTWDFDNKDGVQVDAEGRSVKHRFRVSGDFVVTLTARDAYGLKAPYSTTIKVHVN